MTTWQYTDNTRAVVSQTMPNGAVWTCSVSDPHVQAWIAAGNTPASCSVSPASQAYEALSAGVEIVSASTPSLNGIYSLDPQSISDIQAETVFLLVNGGQFTAGTTLQWPDASGALHTFTSSAQFQAWASAVARYVGALRAVINGIPGAALPAAPVSIP